MEENEETEEQRLERLEDEEFARTGVFTISTNIEINITEEDLVKQLVKDTEGQTIDPDKIYKPGEN